MYCWQAWVQLLKEYDSDLSGVSQGFDLSDHKYTDLSPSVRDSGKPLDFTITLDGTKQNKNKQTKNKQKNNNIV